MITLRPNTWWFLAGAFALCLFALCVVIFSETIQTQYLRETEGQRLQREFGFRSDNVRTSPESDATAFAITAVEPNGAFARAGVLVGDRPWDYHGRSELSFYYTLQAARHREVVLRVSRLPPGGEFPRLVEIRISLEQPRPNSALVAAPPRTPDRVAELRTFDPTSPDAHPNPPLDPASLKCYSVSVEPPFEQLSPPREIELTREPAGTFGFHQLYVVESEGKRSTFWTWRPYTPQEIRVTLGNGFVGWSLSLRPVPNGFDGQAIWMSDSMERHEAHARVRRVACR